MKDLKKYLDFQYLILFLFLLCIQQVLMGISTYYLGLIPQEISDKGLLISRLMVFLISTLLYFGLVILIRKFEILNQAKIYQNIFLTFLNKYKGSPAIWIQKKHKDSFQVSIGYKIFQSASGLFLSSTEIFRYVLGFVIESIAISFVLDFEFLIAIVVSFMFSMGVTLFSQKTLEKYSVKNSQSENRFFSFLNLSWDYFFLKNETIQNKFSSRLDLKYEVMTKNLSRMYSTSEVIVFLNAVLVLLPIFVFDLYLILSSNVSQFKILALIPLIPRQMAMANNVRALGQMITFFKMDLAGFKMNLNILELKELNLNEKINLSQIEIDGIEFKDFDGFESLMSTIQSKKNGRLTVTGKNGAGKSMLLLSIHNKLEKSVYLPSSLPLMKNSLSTGQAHRRNIEQFLKFDSKVYLLDEWDANLDAQIIQELNQKIELLSRTALVIEIRHFNSAVIE